MNFEGTDDGQGYCAHPVSGLFSAKRPNKTPVFGVEVVGRCEGNNREYEVGVLSVREVSGGSSNVRNMTCAREDECVGDSALKEHGNVSLSHAREKIASVSALHPPSLNRESSFPVRETNCKKKSHYAQYSCHSLDDHQEDGSEEDHHTDDEGEGEFDHVCEFHCRS